MKLLHVLDHKWWKVLYQTKNCFMGCPDLSNLESSYWGRGKYLWREFPRASSLYDEPLKVVFQGSFVCGVLLLRCVDIKELRNVFCGCSPGRVASAAETVS